MPVSCRSLTQDLDEDPAEAPASKEPGAAVGAGGDELQLSAREMASANWHADSLSTEAEEKVSRRAELALMRQPALSCLFGQESQPRKHFWVEDLLCMRGDQRYRALREARSADGELA